MKKVTYLALCVLLSFIWIPLVSAGPNDSPAVQNQQGQVYSSAPGNDIIPPRAGISWKEKVMIEREIQKRARASRTLLMRQAAIEKQKESRNAVQQKP
jgi:hypothetical protein